MSGLKMDGAFLTVLSPAQ